MIASEAAEALATKAAEVTTTQTPIAIAMSLQAIYWELRAIREKEDA